MFPKQMFCCVTRWNRSVIVLLTVFQRVAEGFRGVKDYFREFYKTARGAEGDKESLEVRKGWKKVGRAILGGSVREDRSRCANSRDH